MIFKKFLFKLGTVVHTFNPSSWEAEVNGSLNQPDLQSKIQDGQGTTEKPCLENPK